MSGLVPDGNDVFRRIQPGEDRSLNQPGIHLMLRFLPRGAEILRIRRPVDIVRNRTELFYGRLR